MQTSIDLSTLLVVRELASGDCVVFPVAEPGLASYGSEAACLVEQREFLAEYLSSVPPETLARFSLPEGTALVEVDVVIPRDDLPRRLAIETPIAVPCVVIGRWVVVLPLRHTFYLGAGDELEACTRDEVRRMVGAEELSPWAWLSLLPGRSQRVERVDLRVERVERLPPGRAGSLRKKLAARQKRREAREVLETVARPLHTRGGPPLPIVGREGELAFLGTLLGGPERLSVLLSGPDLSGKTALLEAWVGQERKKKSGREVWATSEAQLIAGMSGLGQWQERVRRVLEAAESIDAILYFDALADLFAERAGGVDLGGAIKPFLDERRVRLVGEVRADAVDRLEGRNPAFFGCLSRVTVPPLDVAATRRALSARIDHAARHEPARPNLTVDAVQPLLDLADRYLPYRAFPGKAMRLFDELRAVHEAERDEAGRPITIGAAHVFSLFSLQTGIPAFLLREERALFVEDVVGALAQRMIGQEEAVRRVAETVCVVKAGLQPPGKPLATFLFVGPTGVGKTELARSLAAYLFGSEDRLVRFDMSEYMDVLGAERLIRGPADGGRAEGLLTKRIREQPFSVLLLDEIEKAHPSVFDLLLQVAGEGRLTDAAGRTAWFHNAIIIMTSNLGAAHRHDASGFLAAPEADASYYLREVDRAFRPEFVNRLDRVIAFRPLSAGEVREVARVALARILERRGLTELGARLEVSEEAMARLAREGFSPAYGARALRRHLEDRLVAPVARLLASTAGDARNATIAVGESLVPALRRPPPQEAKKQVGIAAITGTRLRVDRALDRERAREVKEQIEYLVAQLNYGAGEGGAAKSARETSALLAEHQRLSDVWRPAEATQREIWALEELALPAAFEGENLETLVEEAQRLERRFTAEAVHVLLAQEKHRDAITLIAQELDAGRALDRWLAPLLRDLRRRTWSLTAHVDAMKAGPSDDWRHDRRWGPPRPADWLLGELAARDRAPMAVLLRVSGPWAGVLLALEAGLHRFRGQGESEPRLLVTRLAMRVTLTEPEWEGPASAPVAPKTAKEIPVAKAVRDHVTNSAWTRILAGRSWSNVTEDDYWARFEELAWLHLAFVDEEWDEQFKGRLD